MQSLIALLKELHAGDVHFIVVGGMASVLHGAPVTTLDLDIVPERSPDNIQRLLVILERLDARYRGQPRGQVLRPTVQNLAGSGRNNLSTILGPLDVLGELSPEEDYSALFPFSQTVSDGDITVRILSLEKLIEVKTEIGRDKDRLMLPSLLRLLKRETEKE